MQTLEDWYIGVIVENINCLLYKYARVCTKIHIYSRNALVVFCEQWSKSNILHDVWSTNWKLSHASKLLHKKLHNYMVHNCTHMDLIVIACRLTHQLMFNIKIIFPINIKISSCEFLLRNRIPRKWWWIS